MLVVSRKYRLFCNLSYQNLELLCGFDLFVSSNWSFGKICSSRFACLAIGLDGRTNSR